MEKNSSPAETSGKQKVRSAEVGTDILKALAELSPATSLSRLAEHVGMPASKVHRYLQALIASGFAVQDASTNHYSLGREALRVGLAALDSSLVFAAFLPEREVAELREEELAGRADHPLADPAAYAVLLEGIRARGLHAIHGLLMPGVEALSAPVFDARGRVAAVLTVVGPASIFQAEEQGPAAERLLATTRAISWRMGYDGTQGG